MISPSAVFSALADPTRREIISFLRTGPLGSGEIAERFPLAWATISRHLSVLKEAGLVVAHRNGTSIQYELHATVLQDVISHVMDLTDYGGNDE
jgi:DNA-binding transcriptional ArsR family regulator